MTVPLTREVLAELRKKAETAEGADPTPPPDMDAVSQKEWATSRMEEVATPAVVLALLDRIEALEEEMARGGTMSHNLMSQVLGHIAAGASDHKTAGMIGAHLVRQGERIEALESVARRASAELRHTYGHREQTGRIDPNLVARAIRLLEEATTTK